MTREVAEARREEMERVVAFLRAQIQQWRAADAVSEKATLRERARAALFEAANRRWLGRLEQLCVQLESEVVRLRTQEHRAAGPPRGLLSKLFG